MKVLNLADKEVTKVIAKKQRAAMKGSRKKKVKAPKIDEDTSLEALEKLLGVTDKPKKRKKVKLREPLRGRSKPWLKDLPKVNFRDCGTSKKVVEQAIEGVRLLEAKRHSDSECRKKSLLDNDEEDTILYLQVGMMKVASTLLGARHVIRPVKLKVFLPNPVVNESTNVLLITRDSEDSKDIRSDHSENLFHYQHMLRKSGAAKHISEVITLKQLKTEYKEYEAKRMLANRTDVILCDSCIVFRVPLFLGKHFLAKRKFPFSINLKANNLLREVERCLSCEILLLPMKGTSGLMKIGRLGQSNDEIMANLKVALQVMKAKFPGGWGNVKILNLKTENSKSIPFYINMNSLNTIRPIEPKPLSVQPHVTGELTTTGGHIFTVKPDNEVKLVRLGPKSEKAIHIREKKEKRMQEEERKKKKRAKKRAKRKAAAAAANGKEEHRQDEAADGSGAEQHEQDEDAVTNDMEQQQIEADDMNIIKNSRKKKRSTTNVEDEAGFAKKKQKCDKKEIEITAPENISFKSKKKKQKCEEENIETVPGNKSSISKEKKQKCDEDENKETDLENKSSKSKTKKQYLDKEENEETAPKNKPSKSKKKKQKCDKEKNKETAPENKSSKSKENKKKKQECDKEENNETPPENNPSKSKKKKKKQKCDKEENKETAPENKSSKFKKNKKQTFADTTDFDLDYENLEEFAFEDFELNLEREEKETPAKKKGPKSKKKKLEEAFCMDLDLDSDDDQKLKKLERDFLRSLDQDSKESTSGKGKSKKKAAFDEDDDWAEDSYDEGDGMDDFF